MVAIFRSGRTLIGNLPHRIEIQQPIEIRDDQGGVMPGWDTIALAWASVEPLRGKEFWTAQQTQATVTHRIRLRWNEQTKPGYRVLFRGRSLNIGVIINKEERNEEMELLCTEVV